MGKYVSETHYSTICLILFIVSVKMSKYKNNIFSKIGANVSKVILIIYFILFILAILQNIKELFF